MARMLTFKAYTEFGKCDSVSWELDYEVSEEQYQALINAAKNGIEFSDAEELGDLYDDVYAEAVAIDTQNQLEYNYDVVEEYIEDFVAEGNAAEDWQSDEVYMIGVNYPAEIEALMYEDDE